VEFEALSVGHKVRPMSHSLPLQSFEEVITVVVTGFLFHADGISPKT